MAADFQNKYTNPCKLSPDGHFGSKFVTVVVTGKADTTILSLSAVNSYCNYIIKKVLWLPNSS